MYKVGNSSFRTKEDVKDRVRRIIKDAGIGGEFLRAAGGNDFAFLEALLRFHPEAGEKLAAGVSGIHVVAHDKYNTASLAVEDNEGNLGDAISWQKCVANIPKV